MKIMTNISAVNANNRLKTNNGNAATTLEKLSSGFRVNRAADDAAGLAISEKMRAQIRGLDQAARNVGDGVSLLQTAEGGLNESHSVLHRIRELSVQASNGTYSQDDRDAIQKEIDQLVNELDHISTHTNFNGIQLLDGTLADPSAVSTVMNVSLEDALATMQDGEFALVYYDFETTQTGGAPDALASNPMYDSIRQTLKDEIVPNAVQSILDAYPAFYYLVGSSIGIGLELYNDPSSSTMAYVGSGAGGNSKIFQLGVNLAYADVLPADGVVDPALRTDLEATIAHEMMHAFMFEATTNGMLSGDRFPLWFIEGMAQTAGGGMDWVQGTLGSNPSNAEIANAFADLTAENGASEYSYGYLAAMYIGHMAAGGGAVTAENISYGLGQVMGSIISGNSLDATLAMYTQYSGLQDFEDNLQNDAGAMAFVRNLISAAGANGRGSIVSGSLSAENILPDSALVMRLFELDPNSSTVTNVYPSSVNVWSGGGARNNGTPPVSGYAVPGQRSPMILHVGANTDERVSISIDRVNASSLGVSRLSVKDVDSANAAIDAVDKAINKVSGVRAKIGAMQNRLEHALSNISNSSENLQRSESNIRDLDMAKGMMDFTKQNILSQASQAMLAQANQFPQGILQLLRAS